MLEITLAGLAVCFTIFCILLWLEPDNDWDQDEDVDL